MRLAGLKPCGVLCELTLPDGSMARLPDIVAFAVDHDMGVLSVEDLVAYRSASAGFASGGERFSA